MLVRMCNSRGSHSLLEKMQNVQEIWQICTKLNILLYDPATVLLDIYQNEFKTYTDKGLERLYP